MERLMDWLTDSTLRWWIFVVIPIAILFGLFCGLVSWLLQAVSP